MEVPASYDCEDSQRPVVLARLGGVGLRTGRGRGGSTSMGPVLVSYLCTVEAVGEAGAACQSRGSLPDWH